MRELLRLMMLAWASAVLVTGPVLAAVECRRCCSSREASPQEECCSHCVAEAGAETPDCCQQPCSSEPNRCPKCQLSKPAPMTPVSAVDQLVITLNWLPLETPLMLANSRQAGDVRHNLADPLLPLHPPLQILHCRWQE